MGEIARATTIERLRGAPVQPELLHCEHTLLEDVESLTQNAEGASKPARSVFAFHLSLHAYAFLAVGGLGVADFLRPITIVPLPMIDVSLPIAEFFVVMPLLSIGVGDLPPPRPGPYRNAPQTGVLRPQT